jgi:hypothetical protein
MTNLVFVQYGIADPRHQHHSDEEGNEDFPSHIDNIIREELEPNRIL